MNNALKYIEIFTDGACRGNPGVGGWGAILIYKDHKKRLADILKTQPIILWNSQLSSNL